MRLWSWWPWRSDQDKFAALVRDELLRTGHFSRIRYDKAAFALHLDGAKHDDQQSTVFLHNLFASFSQLSAAERPAALKRIISFVTESRAPVPATFAEVSSRLLPSVRSMVELGMWELQCELKGSAKAELPHRRVTEAWAAWLALDRSESIMRLSADHLASWGVGFDEAFEIALGNLRANSAKPFSLLAPGLYCSDWGDGYDTSRLLLTDIIASLPVRGMPVAMAPHRDALLVTGADDADGLKAMARVVQSLQGGPRPISAETICLEGGSWRDFVPDPSRADQEELAELQEVQASIDYEAQKALLDARYAKYGEDVFVANHWLRRERETGRFRGSFGTWSEGVDTLLPKAQSIALVRIEEQHFVYVPWERVVAIAGELMVPMGWWPERFRVRSFPSSAQFAEIEAAAEVLPDPQAPGGAETGGASAGAAMDPSQYPKSYGISLRWKAITIGASISVIAAGVAGIGYALFFDLAPREANTVLLIAPVLMALAAYSIADVLKWRVTLEGDAIEVLSLRVVRRLLRSDIKGYRVHGAPGSMRAIALVPSDPAQKKLYLPFIMNLDTTYFAWFWALENLDASDLRSSEEEIAADPVFGRTQSDRLQRLTRSRQVARALDIATIAALAWAFLAPWPYGLAMATLGALPLVALVLVIVSRGLFRLDGPANDARASLGLMFFLPELVLMIRVILDLDLLNWWPPIIAGIAVGVVLMAIAAAVDRHLRRRPWMVLGCMLFASAYGFGATVEANALLDRSQPSVFRSTVISKKTSRGRVTRYLLELSPWGELKEPVEATVSRALHDMLEPGASACVVQRRGAFGFPWFIVLACQ